LTVSFFILCDN